MTLADLEFDHDLLVDLCRRYGIVRLEVFGSYARGDATPDSDVDVLVTFATGHAVGLEFFGIPDELARVFGHPVDLLTRASVECDRNALFRDRVLHETRMLFHAAA